MSGHGQTAAQSPQKYFQRFFSGDLNHKKIVVWGNSTVSFEDEFFRTLAKHAAPGDVLEGLQVAPEVDNTEVGSASSPSRNQNGHIHRLGNIINMGNNGGNLRGMLGTPGGSLFYRIDAVCSEAPDLLILRGPLINDVRMGTCDLDCAKGLEKQMLDRITACSPKTDVLLLAENSLLTTDVGKHGYISPETPEAAQAYSTILRDAILSFHGIYPNVDVMDLQEELYGATSVAASPYMHDQLHPAPEGQQKEAELVIERLRRSRQPRPKPR
jgi:hypothetical protein